MWRRRRNVARAGYRRRFVFRRRGRFAGVRRKWLRYRGGFRRSVYRNGRRLRGRRLYKRTGRGKRQLVTATRMFGHQKVQLTKRTRRFRRLEKQLINNGGQKTQVVGASSTRFANPIGEPIWWAAPCVSTSVLDLAQRAASPGGTFYVDYNTVHLATASNQFMFKNNGSHEVQLEGWLCYPRRDLPAAVDEKGVPVFQYLGQSPPKLLNGFTRPFHPGLNAVTGDTTLATPYNSPDWCSVFKIRKRFNVWLKPGGVFEMDSSLPKSFKYTIQSFDTNKDAVIGSEGPVATKWEVLRKLGPVTLVKLSPGIVHHEVDSSPSGAPGMGLFSCDAVTYARFESINVALKLRQVGLTNDLPTLAEPVVQFGQNVSEPGFSA